MLNNRFKNDGKAILELSESQEKTKQILLGKIINQEYQLEDINCTCGSDEYEVLSEKDRYGLPVKNIICKQCGLIRISPRLNQKSYNDFYTYLYRDLYIGIRDKEEYFESRIETGKQIYSFLKQQGYENYKTVLEIGCASGGILYPFKEYGKEITGIDYPSEYFEYGKSKGLNLISLIGKEASIAKQKKYDLIIMNHVLEHCLDLKQQIREVAELLSEQGVAYIEVPGVMYLHNSYNCDFLRYTQNAHVYSFSKDTLANLLEEQGLKVLYKDEVVRIIASKEDICNREKENWYSTIKAYLEEIELNQKVYYRRYIDNILNHRLMVKLKDEIVAGHFYIEPSKTEGQLTIYHCNSENKRYILSKYAPEKGIHSKASKWEDEAEVVILFGYGLGYYLKYLSGKGNTKQHIFVIEPDMNWLEFQLQFNNCIEADNNIRFFTGVDVKKLKEQLDEVIEEEMKIRIVPQMYYQDIYPLYFKTLMNILERKDIRLEM